jgi:hypothetical protein
VIGLLALLPEIYRVAAFHFCVVFLTTPLRETKPVSIDSEIQ